MLSSHWPPCAVLALKIITVLVGLAAAVVAWIAARLWLEASKVRIDYLEPLTEVSYEDAPALGITDAKVFANALQAAYNASAAKNASAARWTAGAAILAGVATLLGTL